MPVLLFVYQTSLEMPDDSGFFFVYLSHHVREKLRISTGNEYPPYAVVGPDEVIMGVDCELICALSPFCPETIMKGTLS